MQVVVAGYESTVHGIRIERHRIEDQASLVPFSPIHFSPIPDRDLFVSVSLFPLVIHRLAFSRLATPLIHSVKSPLPQREGQVRDNR